MSNRGAATAGSSAAQASPPAVAASPYALKLPSPSALPSPSCAAGLVPKLRIPATEARTPASSSAASALPDAPNSDDPSCAVRNLDSGEVLSHQQVNKILSQLTVSTGQ